MSIIHIIYMYICTYVYIYVHLLMYIYIICIRIIGYFPNTLAINQNVHVFFIKNF